MSVEAPGLGNLKRYIQSGPISDLTSSDFLGIVGDENHKSGYHLGPDRTPANDYSERTDRDKRGAQLYPRYACAIDISMAWARSRNWLAWFVQQCKNGAYPDVREIIGSLDGKKVLYWSALTGFATQNYTGKGHDHWTHLSIYRDSAERDATKYLRDFVSGVQVPVPPALSMPGTRDLYLASPMMTGEDVKYVQRWIGPKHCGVADGRLGPKTNQGIIWFNRMRGRTTNLHVITREVWQEMRVTVRY